MKKTADIDPGSPYRNIVLTLEDGKVSGKHLPDLTIIMGIADTAYYDLSEELDLEDIKKAAAGNLSVSFGHGNYYFAAKMPARTILKAFGFRVPKVSKQVRRKTCAKCGGTGFLRQYARINGGECFACK